MLNIIGAAETIRNEKIVIFPTETVYGIGGDARSSKACEKIYKIKNRPPINPLIIHVDSFVRACSLGYFNENATKLAEAFWPGPLTLIVPAKKDNKISPIATGNLDTIAIRFPAHNIIRDLIKYSNCPIAAPSANPSGCITSTRLSHIKAYFSNQIPILEGGVTYGIESTIVDARNNINILRQGFITQNSICNILGKNIVQNFVDNPIIAPGMLTKHYAPKSQLKLNTNVLYDGQIGLDFGKPTFIGQYSLNLSKKSDIIEAAANLYDMLYKLDSYATINRIETIVVKPIPNHGVGAAINDRLIRAAGPS